MIFERSLNSSYTCNIIATQSLQIHSLNGKVFKHYEDNKLIGIGYRTDAATQDIYFCDYISKICKLDDFFIEQFC